MMSLTTVTQLIRSLVLCLQKEPADNAEELLNGIKYVRPGNGYEPNFTMFKKTEINGENEHPLFTFLKVR